MGRAVGIDLGTTNSCIATLEGGQPTVIVNAEGARTTPSVVAFSKSGEILVGEVAKRQAVTNVDRTISSVKRHMGTDSTVEIDGQKWTPQEISAQVLMKLKRDAEAYLGEPGTDADAAYGKQLVYVPEYAAAATATLGWRRWTLFFRVVGLNSITIYLAQRIVGFGRISDFFLGGVASKCPEALAAVVDSAGYVAVCWLFLYFLYRKNVFLKV